MVIPQYRSCFRTDSMNFSTSSSVHFLLEFVVSSETSIVYLFLYLTSRPANVYFLKLKGGHCIALKSIFFKSIGKSLHSSKFEHNE